VHRAGHQHHGGDLSGHELTGANAEQPARADRAPRGPGGSAGRSGQLGVVAVEARAGHACRHRRTPVRPLCAATVVRGVHRMTPGILAGGGCVPRVIHRFRAVIHSLRSGLPWPRPPRYGQRQKESMGRSALPPTASPEGLA
jgi:hypothetical protein